MTIYGGKEHNTRPAIEHAYSHDIGNWTFVGFKRSGLYEVEFADIADIIDATSFMVKYLMCKNIVSITRVLVESKRLTLAST
jgi:hypothetical protein